MTSKARSTVRSLPRSETLAAEAANTPRNRLLFWLAMALAPEAITWNWGGYTPALLSYSQALQEAQPASSALEAEAPELEAATPMARAA